MLKIQRANHCGTEENILEINSTHNNYHVLFQSTSLSNIQSINMLSKCSMFDKNKEKLPGKNKHKWIIEMNEARQLYLNMYFKVECIDQIIQNAKMTYRTCKYWHSPMTHVKYLAVVVAYNLYLEL